MRASPLQTVVGQNVANLYAEPSTDSGMVSQAVFGAPVGIQDERSGFCHVATEDRYQGWIQTELLTQESETADAVVSLLFAEVFERPASTAERRTKLVAGSRVLVVETLPSGWVAITLPHGTRGYLLGSALSSAPASALLPYPPTSLRSQDITAAIGRMAAETAKLLIGTPYLWGGCTPFGLDCSGLTQIAFKMSGVQLLRDAHLQFSDRRFVPVEAEQSLETAILEEGDLVVFSRRADKHPTHIGIALGDGRFLHARGGRGVRIDFCDAAKYRQTYVGAIRLSADADLAVEAA